MYMLRFGRGLWVFGSRRFRFGGCKGFGLKDRRFVGKGNKCFGFIGLAVY